MSARPPVLSPRADTAAWRVLDLARAFTTEPPPLDFVWPGFLAGTVGALIAPGATGKSFWSLEAAMSVACSVAGGNIVGLETAHSGRVVYFAGEDPEPVLHQRARAIGQHLSPQARRAITGNLTLVSLVGRRLNVADDAQLDSVIDLCDGSRLIVLDTLSRIHEFDENSNSGMSRLVGILEFVAARTGAAVLFLHHVSKGSAREGQLDQQQAARGASALIDNARWCGFLARMTEGEAARLSDRPFGRQPIGNDRRGFFVRMGTAKQNYGQLTLDRWLRFEDGGVLVPVELVEAAAGVAKDTGRRRDEV